MRAYPDNQQILQQCKKMMAAFGQRTDVQRFHKQLKNSGIAGTAITDPFFAATAERLARRWPQDLSIVWGQDENIDLLVRQLQPMAMWSETPGLDEIEMGAKKWLNELRGKQADGAFVAQRLAEVYPDAFTFEIVFEQLRLTMQLEPSHDSPSRTNAEAPVNEVHFQTGPVRAQRPAIAEVLREQPRAIRELSRQEGQRYVEMARNAMVTRERDLDAFAYADANDVRLVEWEDGLTFAAMGLVPERRLMLESVYGFLTLRNGVPTGYVLTSALSGSAGIAYNVFDTFRGGEAAWIYDRVLAERECEAEALALFGKPRGLAGGAWFRRWGPPRHRATARGQLVRRRAQGVTRRHHEEGLTTRERLRARVRPTPQAAAGNRTVGRYGAFHSNNSFAPRPQFELMVCPSKRSTGRRQTGTAGRC